MHVVVFCCCFCQKSHIKI